MTLSYINSRTINHFVIYSYTYTFGARAQSGRRGPLLAHQSAVNLG